MTQPATKNMKVCVKCKEVKALELFKKNSKFLSGYTNCCKDCHSRLSREKRAISAVSPEFTGTLTLQHYKEPLRKVPEGYGYVGALAVTTDGEYVQCHICGQLYRSLSSHIRGVHGMKVSEYKDKFELAPTTALLSENERKRLKDQTLRWLSSLTLEQKAEYKASALNYWKEWREGRKKRRPKSKDTLERKNQRGTCPDQLLDKIKQVAEKLGKQPSLDEFVWECGSTRYIQLIKLTFGTWSKAMKILGYDPLPTSREPGYRKKQYTDEELLEYLRIFAQENNRRPTQTDFRRGLLPDYGTYLRRWGSIETARQLAGVYEFIYNHGTL